MIALQWRDWLQMGAVLLIAAFMRLPALDVAPPGFQFDEAYNAWDALRVIEGARPIFLSANGGREPLYTYWQALFVSLWGPTPTALRLASALPGIATVLLLYGFVRLLFPSEGTGLPCLAALCLALSYWHLHFSRYGIRSILVPFWGLLTFAALWVGLRQRSMGWFALCGAGLAAMVWTHPMGRLAPIVVMLVVLYFARADREWAKRHLLGLLIAALVAVFLCLPLGYYFWQHPDQFFAHISDVSIFQPRVHGGNLPRTLILNGLRVAGMFTCMGDREWLHNLPGRPTFDPLLGIGFLVGVTIASQRLLRQGLEPLQRAPYCLLGAWLVVFLVPSAFSDMVPNFSRTIGVAPAVMLLAAWGIREGWRWLKDRGHPCLAMGLVAMIMSVSGGWTGWDYFVRFARHPKAYYHYDQDKVDVATFLHQESVENTLYLAPLWAQHPTVTLLTQDIDLRSVETNVALVFPVREGSRGVLYAFPPEQEQNVAILEQAWGRWGRRDVVRDPQGNVLLYLFRIPAVHRPLWGEGAAFVADGEFPLGMLERSLDQFGSSIRLLGYRAASGLSAERELEVTLVWEALGSVDRNYAAFVHLLDEHGERWGQADNWPGQGSYPTSHWHPGDVIVDRYKVKVHPCPPPGRYRLEVGWYDLTTGERLQKPGGGLACRLGVVDIASAQDLDRKEVSPSSQADYWPSDEVHLFGFNVPETPLEVGRPFPVTLYWEAAEEVQEPLAVLFQLKSSDDHAIELASLDVGGREDSPWLSGKVRCQTLRLHLEPVPEGIYQLHLQALGEPQRAVDIAKVQVVPSTRCYTPPPISFPVKQDVGYAIRLLGCNTPRMTAATSGLVMVAPGGTLHLTLYWQMLHAVETSYTVFAHLLDETGQLRGQKDNIPMQGTYPTTEWAEGEVVEDPYQIAVASDAPPGSYQIEVGLYDAATGQRLRVTSEGQEKAEDRILLPVRVIVSQ